MAEKLNQSALGYAAAILSAAGMLLLGIGGNIGVYAKAAEQMMRWHMFFSLSITGIITGMIEAAIISFVFVYAFGWVYNKFVQMVKRIIKQGKAYFQCEECKFLYKDKKWAEKCEAYCKNYNSCSLEITKHAINID